MEPDKLNQIHNLIKEIVSEKKNQDIFVPGKSKVHYSKPLFDENEINAVIDSLIDGWLAEGKKTAEFEERFSDFIGSEDCVLINSGSSALMIAIAALMNKGLENPIKPGEEIITTALTFPTTLNAILLNNLVPVLVDVNINTYNINPEIIETMITEKTRAILAVHYLGNPCEMDRIIEIAKKHNLFVIEDCCDAHGSEYQGRKVGSFGDLSCFSFYCAHTMTMGEGGAILFNNKSYRPILLSLKTCGRSCVCDICKVTLDQNYNCPLRWNSSIKGFENFDKRTLHTNIGYKLKILDLQAAFGLKQLEKLPIFIEKRKKNFNFIVNHLNKYNKYLILPREDKHTNPCWFSIPLTIKKTAPFTREDLVGWLEKRNIETRPLLGGNIIKQPAYSDVKYRSSDLKNTNFIHSNSFYAGCHPGLSKQMLNYMMAVFDEFFEKIKQ